METLSHVLRGLLGIAAFVGICYIFSANRKAINWRLVAAGIFLQIVIGVLILYVPPVRVAFDAIGVFFVKLLDFTRAGTTLVFGWLTNISGGNVPDLAFTQGGPIFAVTILPTIIFFGAFTSLLYRMGVLQIIVFAFAWVMSKAMKLSGAETLSASANIFVGQTEAPLLIKPYLGRMTKSEMLAIMIGGMANTAGGVMAVYVTLLGGDDKVEQARWAMHLLTASVLSAPASLYVAKILLPQEEEIDSTLRIADEKPGVNFLDAICLGTTDGVKLAVNVGAMLIVFTALVALANWALYTWVGGWSGLNAWIVTASGGRYDGLSLQLFFGLLGAPVAWLMGINGGSNLMAAGQLLGEKTVLNEFYAFFTMKKMQATGALTDDRTRLILSYALCGFANLASIGIQIGGIGALAPEQRPTLARLGWAALLGGSVACFIDACIVGMLT